MDVEQRQRIQALMVRFADGDREAFDALFAELWPLLRDYAARALGSGSDAEDTAQQALLKVFARVVDFDRDRDAVSWAFGIAAYEVLTLRKRHVRRRETDGADLEQLRAPLEAPDSVAEQNEHQRLVSLLVAELSDRDQAALALGLEGAGVLGETQRKQRFRATQRLREAWRRLYG